MYITVARLGHDGSIYPTLSSTAKIPGVKIAPDKWFNFRLEMIPANATSYTYYIYVDDVLVYTNGYSKAPAQSPQNYRILAGDKDVGYSAMLDNIEFRTLPLVPNPDRVDTTIDFENLDSTVFTDKYYINAERLTALNTDKTAVSTSWVGSSTMNSSIVTSSNANYNRVWQNASARAYFVVDDLENRLINRDFTVSADFMFSTFPEDKTSLIQWLRGSSLSSITTNEFLYIDRNGELCQNGVEIGKSVGLNEWFNVTLKVSYAKHNLYNVVTYVNGELVSVTDMQIACKANDTDGSFIRFMSTANAAFKACMDNIQIYESDNAKIYEEKDVIWDLDFDGLTDGETTDTAYLNDCSLGYENIRNLMGSTAVASDGGLKITPALNRWIDLKLGGGNYDPVKEGPVSISFKFNLASKDTAATAKHRLIGLRRVWGYSDNTEGATADVLVVKNNALIFFGVEVISELEVNKDYNFEVVIDGKKNTASLYVDEKKIIDTMQVSNQMSAILGEGKSYVTDDAGIRHFLPYSGFVSQQKYDSEGVAIADTYEKRFVQNAGYGVDILRLFQVGDATPSGIVYYVDDIKIERVETGNVFMEADFTGATLYAPTNTNAATTAYSYLQLTNASSGKEENGNEYLHFTTGTSLIRLTDRQHESMYKGMELSFDMRYKKLDSPANTTATNIVALVGSTDVQYADPFNKCGSYFALLGADAAGNLYDATYKDVYFENADQEDWINIRIVFLSDGKKWTGFEYYINGDYIATFNKGISTWKDYYIRIFPNNRCEFDIDNLSYKYLEEPTYDFTLDFDGDYETMLETMGSDYRYPAIDSTRTDANGGTVTSAQVLGTDDKYLRIDRTLLATDQTGCIKIDNHKYIGENEYIVETDFRFSCDAGFGITPVTIVAKGNEKRFTPIQVKGADNTLSMSMRGASYALYNSAGNLLTVKTTNDTGFTKLAVLINENNSTYTVYVDGRVAYYFYDEEYLPCVNIPITYKETGVSTVAEAGLRLMEIDGIKHNYSIIDIDKVAVIPAPSGLATSFRATQTKIDNSNDMFDIRFIAGIDALYGSNIGFDVTTVYTDGTEKTSKKSMSDRFVYSSIVDEGDEVMANNLGSNYLFVMSVTELPTKVGEVYFEVTPFVVHGGIKVSGAVEYITANFADGKVTVK